MANGHQFWLERSNLQKPQTEVVEGETVTQDQITTTQTSSDVPSGEVINQQIQVKKIVSFKTPGEKVLSILEASEGDARTAVEALTAADEAAFPTQWVIEGLENHQYPLTEIGRFQGPELDEKLGALVALDQTKGEKVGELYWGEDWIIYRKTYQAQDTPALNEKPSQRSILLQNTQPIERVPNPTSEGPVGSKNFAGEHIIIVRAQKQLPVEEKKIEQPASVVSNPAQPSIIFGPKSEPVAASAPVAGGNPFYGGNINMSFAPGWDKRSPKLIDN